MDNNKNKQFFWQVKDFLSKKPTPAPSVPQNGLKSTINSVINSPINKAGPNIYEDKARIVNSSNDVKNSVVNNISSFIDATKKQAPNMKAYTKNITTNPFNNVKK